MKINALHIMNTIDSASNEYKLAQGLMREGFNIIPVSFLANGKERDTEYVCLNGRSKFDMRAIKKLEDIIRRSNIHILHTHHNVSGSIARIMARIHNVPIIVDTEHGSHKCRRLAGNIFNDITLPYCSKIVNVSQWVQDSYQWWEKPLIPRGRTCVVYNGVDPFAIDDIVSKSDIENYDRRYFGKGDKVFIHVGRFVKVKNQINLIKGFAKACGRYGSIKLLMAGEGELGTSLERLSWGLGLSEKVIFTGLVSREKLYRLMKQSFGFVMNSRSEGLSVALLEAMALRLPCILSDIPSFRETVKGCDIGEFILRDDPDEVADAFLRLLSTEESVLKLKGDKARAIVEKNYSFETMIRSYKQIYNDLLEKAIKENCAKMRTTD